MDNEDLSGKKCSMNPCDGQVKVVDSQHAKMSIMSINAVLGDGCEESILDIINAAIKTTGSITAPVTAFRTQSDLYNESRIVAIFTIPTREEAKNTCRKFKAEYKARFAAKIPSMPQGRGSIFLTNCNPITFTHFCPVKESPHFNEGYASFK